MTTLRDELCRMSTMETEDFDDIVRSTEVQQEDSLSATADLDPGAVMRSQRYRTFSTHSETTVPPIIDEADWKARAMGHATLRNGVGLPSPTQARLHVPVPFSVSDRHADERTEFLTRETAGTATASTLVFCWQMVANFMEATVRGKQARLTLGEFLDHFDVLNDFLFICRVGWTTFVKAAKAEASPSSIINGKIALVCLVCIWCISIVAYGTRRHLIYHRITGKNVRLFYPIVVFSQIREVGDNCPEVLYMFERLFWTYQLVMRLVEDIPQVICSAVFLTSFGSDIYTYFMISYSCLLLLLTSLRMGLMYPLLGTLSLILSRQPPVDSPVLTEAASTTKSFALFMFFTASAWLVSSLVCLTFAEGLWILTFSVLAITSAISGLFFIVYWGYLERQSYSSEAQPDEFFETFERLTSPRIHDEAFHS